MIGIITFWIKKGKKNMKTEENKTITMYELIGYIKLNEAPMQIIYDSDTWNYDADDNDYHSKLDNCLLFKSYLKKCYIDSLNDNVKIIKLKENAEWEDIEFENYNISFSKNDIDGSFRNFSYAVIYNKELIEKLIKNQKYLKERLDKNELK